MIIAGPIGSALIPLFGTPASASTAASLATSPAATPIATWSSPIRCSVNRSPAGVPARGGTSTSLVAVPPSRNPQLLLREVLINRQAENSLVERAGTAQVTDPQRDVVKRERHPQTLAGQVAAWQNDRRRGVAGEALPNV